MKALCRHLGFGAYGGVVAAAMEASKTSVPEFHKGVSDRFLSDLSAEEIQLLNDRLAVQIASYRQLAAERMVALGHRMLHDRLVRMRQTRLAEMGLTDPE